MSGVMAVALPTSESPEACKRETQPRVRAARDSHYHATATPSTHRRARRESTVKPDDVFVSSIRIILRAPMLEHERHWRR